ncbi:MAG: glycosyltransferase, partial [Cyclobacteriaceae bacterium]|nr:glycosyltransferase [Cyclobacteriaceae bacterium]
MVKFTIIIPVYNRPSELEELLDSLTHQDYKAFEIIVIDDGSDVEVESQVKDYSRELNIRFIRKENTGQGFSRNIAAQQAHGEYLVFFDSDCLIPESYFKEVESFIGQEKIDAWGGPDRAHDSFTVLQKAISFTMTSVLTTGGIRGKKSHVGKFQPRSFNMGISKEVFLDMGGFHQTNLGEDVELSMRLLEKGCKTVLIERAFV